MHHCVYLFCVQNVAEQIPTLDVTLDELQHVKVFQCFSRKLLCCYAWMGNPALGYLKVWMLLSKSQIVQCGTVV